MKNVEKFWGAARHFVSEFFLLPSAFVLL